MPNRQDYVSWLADTLHEAAWAPMSVLGFYAVGLALGIFDRFPTLDIPTHFLGGVVIAYFYRVAIRRSQKPVGKIPFPVQMLLGFTAAGTTAVLWEFYENLADFFLGTQMVRGLEDTIMDLLTGLLGALVLSLLYRKR